MAQLTVFITLIAIGVAHAGVLNWNPYGLVPQTILGSPYGYGNVITLGAPLQWAGPSVISSPVSTDSIQSTPGGLVASAVPGVNAGANGAGPSTSSDLVGPTAILNGASATLIASTGTVRGHANGGANLGATGSAIAPSSGGSNTPATAQAIQKPGPVALRACPWC